MSLYRQQAYQSIQLSSARVYIFNMNTKILKRLGENLKKYRKVAQLTQEQLAELVGIHPTYVGKLETGKNNPSVKMLYKLSRALKIKLSDIFDFDK